MTALLVGVAMGGLVGHETRRGGGTNLRRVPTPREARIVSIIHKKLRVACVAMQHTTHSDTTHAQPVCTAGNMEVVEVVSLCMVTLHTEEPRNEPGEGLAQLLRKSPT